MYRQGVISKNDKFQTFGFHSSLVLICSLHPITGMSLSDDNNVCAEAQTNPVSLVSLDLITIEQLLDELWLRIRDPSMQPRNLRQLQAALHLEWGWIPKNVVRRHLLLVRPR